MNIYHYILIALYVIGFIFTLHKHGEQKEETHYNAKSSFWVVALTITLIILSAYK